LEGGLVVCSRGELGWGRRRRNRGGKGRQSAHILTFADGLTDGCIPSVISSAILTVNKSHEDSGLNPSVSLLAIRTVNQSRHSTELPF